ncbi:MAG: hypothetical protein LBH58_06665, partial [Tannerellaceae bacterium]|jgi:hypothetical protein|nr:hypothetical protein [Tannerellaceae bacterium]
LFKFGIELDGKLKKVDSGTLLDSPTGVVRLGAFTELNLTRHFSGKLKAGLNNTYIHQDAIHYVTGDHYQAITKVTQSLEFSLEPVFYFFSTEQSRKINPFISLPVMFETKSLGEKYIYQTKFMIVPTLGCRYDFNRHWGIEASGGLGWRKYGKYKIKQKSSEMEYSLSMGIRYSF